jgi:hypothetical protein
LYDRDYGSGEVQMSYELKDYLNAINHEKTNLLDTDDEMWEKKYPSFIINKCLAPFPDTVMLVNEMNKNHHLDKKLQFDFLLNSLRTRKRFTPWLKASKQKNLEYVKEYYGYNNEKAKSALKLLNDEQIKAIKDSLNKGGKNGKH